MVRSSEAEGAAGVLMFNPAWYLPQYISVWVRLWGDQTVHHSLIPTQLQQAAAERRAVELLCLSARLPGIFKWSRSICLKTTCRENQAGNTDWDLRNTRGRAAWGAKAALLLWKTIEQLMDRKESVVVSHDCLLLGLEKRIVKVACFVVLCYFKRK